MGNSSRRSVLQTQILAHLREAPAPSVSALAEAVGSPRPSVSRSLHTLAKQGYVEQHGRCWHITDAGAAIAEEAVEQLAETTEEIIELAGHRFRAVNRLGQGDMLTSTVEKAFNMASSGLLDTAISSYSTTMSDSQMGFGMLSRASQMDFGMLSSSLTETTLQSLNTALGLTTADMHAWSGLGTSDIPLPGDGLAEASRAAMVDGLVDFSGLGGMDAALGVPVNLGEVASHLLAVQTDYASFLSNIPLSDLTIGYGVIGEQTNLLASAIDDTLGLHANAVLSDLQGHAVNELAWIPSSLAAVTGSLADLFHDQVEQLRGGVPRICITDVADRMLLSTRPVAHFVDAARLLIEEENQPDVVETTGHVVGEHDNPRLDALLMQMNPKFVDKRRGSWMALESDNPERLCHAAGSQKNLLTQMIRHIAPEFEVPDDDQPGSFIKARIRQSFGVSKSESDHVKAVANAVYTGYAQFNKYDHTNQTHEGSLRGIMRTAEGLMEIILVHVVAQRESRG